LSFYISKLTFFRGKLKPSNIQSGFENKNYLAMVLDKFLEYLIELETGFHDFMVYYSLGYNLSDKLNIILLSSVLLINLHDINLPRLCNYHPTLLNLFQKTLKAFLYNYPVKNTPYNQIYQYHHEFRKNQTLRIDFSKFKIENFLMFMAYSQNEEIAELVVEIIIRQNWLNVSHSQIILYDFCCKLKENAYKMKQKTNLNGGYNKFLFMGGLETKAQEFDLYSKYQKEFEKINQGMGIQVPYSGLEPNEQGDTPLHSANPSVLDKFIKLLKIGSFLSMNYGSFDEFFNFLFFFLEELELNDLILATKLFVILGEHITRIKNYLNDKEYLVKDQVVEKILGYLQIWKIYFEMSPHSEEIGNLIMNLSLELEEILL
jgi:hypothetical protein